MTLRTLWVIGAFALGLTACSTNSTKVEPAAQSSSEAIETAETTGATNVTTDIQKVGRPALWRVSDADSDVYLFGTFHVLPPNVVWRSSALESAMTDAEITIVEADTQSTEALDAIRTAVVQYGLNPEGVTLTSIVGADRAARLAMIADEVGAPMAALEPMRPWLALISLTQAVFQRSGFDPSEGVEMHILEQAAH